MNEQKRRGKRNRLIVGKDWGEGKSGTDLHVSIYLIFSSEKILTRRLLSVYLPLGKRVTLQLQETLLI